MNIDDVLNRIRTKRIHYNKGGDFTIPLEWKKLSSGMTFALINKEHAKMIAAAAGRDLTPHAMYIPNRDDFLGIGNNSATLMRAADGKYALRHERRDFENPIKLPESIDLSDRLKPPESLETRPSEMIPEDFYM